MNNEFDKFSENYDEILNNNIKNLSEYKSDYYQKYKINIIAKKEHPTKILDFGCGVGLGTKYLKQYFPTADVIGIDVSQECIQQAKKCYPNIKFMTYDGENLDFEDNFDLIYSSCVFHHIEKSFHHSIILNLLKTLKENGKLYIFEHNPLNPLTTKVFKDCIFDKNAQMIYAKDFKKILNCKINYTLFIPRFKLFEKLFFVEKYLTKIPIGAQYYIEAKK